MWFTTLVNGDFYQRPMVSRLLQIFDNPKPPVRVTEQQFDMAQDDLVASSKKPWHEIDRDDYWAYLMDLCYVELQQELFDYLFPALLIHWWEGQLSRFGGPEAEADIYRAIDQGQVFMKMMAPERREAVLQWMNDGYIEGVDAWGGKLSVHHDQTGPNDLHGPLWSFNAIGQSIPITGDILARLTDVCSVGRAQWWLVLSSGLVWNDNEVPFIPAWTPDGGGGGVYVQESEASIYDHGYLPDNLESLRRILSYDQVLGSMSESANLLRDTGHGVWADNVVEELRRDQKTIETRIDRLMRLFSLPDLGGVLFDPLKDPEPN